MSASRARLEESPLYLHFIAHLIESTNFRHFSIKDGD